MIDKIICSSCNRIYEYDRKKGHRRTRCNSCLVTARRQEVKRILIAEHGGKCLFCGYNAYVGALEFHHVDASSKQFGIAFGGVSRSLEKTREEAAKCVLCCSNCHAEIEGGLIPYDVVLDEFERSRSSLAQR